MRRRSLPQRCVEPVAIGFAAGAVCVLVDWANPTRPDGPIPTCPTHALLSVYCPGCGSMRMLYSMIHLDFAAALRYNALAVLALVVLSVTFVSFAVNRVRDRRSRQWYELRYAPAATLALVVGWFVVRNLPFDSFSALRV